jgi:hypothetical protein
MSTTGGFGVNLYDTVAVYDKYVEYRITDPTLNVSNYEPIYAVRGFQLTEMEAEAQSYVENLPVIFVPYTQRRPLDSAVILDGGDEVVPSINEVPEPSYMFVIALMVITIFFRRRNLCQDTGLSPMPARTLP